MKSKAGKWIGSGIYRGFTVTKPEDPVAQIFCKADKWQRLKKYFPGVDINSEKFQEWYNSLPVTKSRMVELKLTRKDAKHLLHVIKYCTNWYCGDTVEEDFGSGKREKLRLKTTLLNKLKRQGIR